MALVATVTLLVCCVVLSIGVPAPSPPVPTVLARVNGVPTGWQLQQIVAAKDVVLAAGDDVAIIRSADGGQSWEPVDAGLIFGKSTVEGTTNYPKVSIRQLASDPASGQWMAVVYHHIDYSTSVITAPPDALSFTACEGLQGHFLGGISAAPVSNGSYWIALNNTNPFVKEPPVMFYATNPAGPWHFASVVLDCDCTISSAPFWSKPLGMFVMLLNSALAASLDGITWKSINQLKYPPLAPAWDVPVLPPVFGDPMLYYITNATGTLQAALLNVTKPSSAFITPTNADLDQCVYMTYSNGFFIRGCTYELMSSLDGVSWVNISSDLPDWRSAFSTFYGGRNPYYLVLGEMGDIYSIDESRQWRLLYDNGIQGSFSNVVWLNGSGAGFYAWGPFRGGPTGLVYSADGFKWEALGVENMTGDQIAGIEYYDQWKIYVSIASDMLTHVVYSKDFLTNKSVHNYHLPRTRFKHAVTTDICLGDNQIAIVIPAQHHYKDVQETLVSTDGGNTWQMMNDSQPQDPLQWCAYGNGIYVAITMPLGSEKGSELYTSTDNGASWILQTYVREIGILKFLNGLFVFVGADGLVASSADGVHYFTKNICPQALNGIGYGNGIYMLVGEGGVAFTSPDLKTFQPLEMPLYTTLTDAAYSPTLNRWVIVGGGGTIVAVWYS